MLPFGIRWLLSMAGCTTCAALAGACPGYAHMANLSNPAISGFKLQRYTGVWYEIVSHNLPVLTTGCSCTRYDIGVRAGGWETDFSCWKGDSLTRLHSDNGGASDPGFPGMLTESWQLPVGHSPATAYWVLDVGLDGDGSYRSALVYSCTAIFGFVQEWIYLFSRSVELSQFEVDSWKAYLEEKGTDITTLRSVPQDAHCWGDLEVVV